MCDVTYDGATLTGLATFQIYTDVVTKLGHEQQQNERIKPEVEKYEQRQRILDDVGGT